jgi:hypothetical protein
LRPDTRSNSYDTAPEQTAPSELRPLGRPKDTRHDLKTQETCVNRFREKKCNRKERQRRTKNTYAVIPDNSGVHCPFVLLSRDFAPQLVGPTLTHHPPAQGVVYLRPVFPVVDTKWSTISTVRQNDSKFSEISVQSTIGFNIKTKVISQFHVHFTDTLQKHQD